MDVALDNDRGTVLPRSKNKRNSYIPRVSASQVAYSFPITFLIFLSAIKYLSFFVVVVFMTIYRVTYPRAFFIYLTGNLLYDDAIIIALGCIISAIFFHKNKRLLLTSIGLILAPLAITVGTSNLLPLDVTSLIMFPGIVAAYYVFRKKIDLGKRITRNSLILTAAGIVLVIEFLSLMTWIIYPSYAPFWDEIFSPTSEWYIAGIEAQLYYAGARLAPIIALILSFSFLVRPGFESLMQLITGRSNGPSAQTVTTNKDADTVAHTNESAIATKSTKLSIISEPEEKYSSDNDTSAIAEIAKNNVEEQHIITSTPDIEPADKLATKSKHFRPNLKARKKFGMKHAKNNQMGANKRENKLSANKLEDRLEALATTKEKTKRSKSRFWLFLSITLVVLFSLYPYIPSINKDFATVSVDSPYYVKQIDNIKNGGLFSKDGPFSFSSERALSVLFFYGMAAILPIVPTNVLVSYLPMFLGSFIALSGYLLVRYGKSLNENEGTHDKAVYFLLPMLVPFSMQFIVGIYGGFFANMLALSFMLLTFLFYLRFLKSGKILDLGLFVTMMFMTLLSHVYTWVFLVATIVISTAILGGLNRKTEKKKNHIIVIASIGIATAALLGLSSLVASKSGVEYLSDLASTNFGENFLGTRWFNINDTFRFYLGGFLANTVLMGLALVWAFKADYKNHFNAIILASMFIFSVFFFLGDEVIQSRIFFNIPLFIPAAIVISNFMAGKYLPSLDSRTRTMIVILIFLYLGNYSLRSLANFYLVEPSTPFT